MLPIVLWLNRGSRSARWVSSSVLAIVLSTVLLASWLGSSNAAVSGNNHFAAVFDPIVQVHLGKNLLVDYGSQYGLYPDLLAPLFAIVGFSVAKCTFVLGMLGAASLALIWWVLRQAVLRPGIAIVGMLAIVFNAWMMFHLLSVRYHPNFVDPYFQYMPLRVVFPACAIALVWYFFRTQTKRVYWSGQLLLAIGLLWNFESGFVAQAAWLAALLFDACYAADWKARVRGAARHGASAIIATAAVAATYATIKFCYFGCWPDMRRMFEFQRLFYVSGFYMLPMHFSGAWQLVVLVYLTGLMQGAMALSAGDRHPRHTLVVMLSVLGLGAFSYYQGRSHELCLILCWWPAIVLLPIFLDELLDFRLRERSLLAYGAIAAIGWFLVGSATSAAGQATELSRIVGAQLADVFAPESPYQATAQLLAEHVGSHEDVLVLSARAPLIHAEAARDADASRTNSDALDPAVCRVVGHIGATSPFLDFHRSGV